MGCEEMVTPSTASLISAALGGGCSKWHACEITAALKGCCSQGKGDADSAAGKNQAKHGKGTKVCSQPEEEKIREGF